MSRSLSWIEADDLAQRLRALGEAEPERAEAGGAPRPREEASTLPPGGAPVREPARTQHPEPIPETPDSRSLPAQVRLQEPQSSFTDAPDHPSYPRGAGVARRLELFRAWMLQLGLGSFFVADEEGLPLLLQDTKSAQAVRAVAFERALHPLRALLGGAPPRALGLELQDGRSIQTIWADTKIGRVAVGMAGAQPLPWALSARVRAAVFGAFEGELS